MTREAGPIAELGATSRRQADWTRCTTDQPGLPDSQYGVSRQISCTSANEYTSPGRPSLPLSAIYCREFRFSLRYFTAGATICRLVADKQ